MAILTLNNRTERADNFYQKTLYLGFGKTTAWSDESDPDPSDETQDEITEMNFIRKADNIIFVKPQVGGEITYRDSEWTEVPYGDIWTENAVNLYMDVTLTFDDSPIIVYRQVGVLEDPLDLASQVCTQPQYLSNEISSQGLLHYIDNRFPTYRAVDQQEKVSIILEF